MNKILNKYRSMDVADDMQISTKMTVKNTMFELEPVSAGVVDPPISASKYSRSEQLLKSSRRSPFLMTMSEDSQTTLTPPDSPATAAEASPHDGPSAASANAAPAGPWELPAFPYPYPAPGAAYPFYVPGEVWGDSRDAAPAAAYLESASSGSDAPAAQDTYEQHGLAANGADAIPPTFVPNTMYHPDGQPYVGWMPAGGQLGLAREQLLQLGPVPQASNDSQHNLPQDVGNLVLSFVNGVITERRPRWSDAEVEEVRVFGNFVVR